MNKFLIDKRKECVSNENVVEAKYPEEFIDLARGVVYRTEKIFSQISGYQHRDDLLDFYFICYDLLKKVDLYDEKYVTYYESVKNDVMMKLYCLDPSKNLKTYMDNAKSVILFSATLTPMNYFIDVLGGKKSSHTLMLSSPFDKDHLCLLVHKNVSTKYKDRSRTYQEVVDTINHAISGKKGNYIVYFPSYQYLSDVYDLFISGTDRSLLNVMKQERGLTETEKEAFINIFHERRENTLLAFAVLGGMFGEGIDLTGEKLSGAIIVGVGLPGLCLERNLIKNHFEGTGHDGFKYAYMYPGMNKVMQAAGRVIRGESDLGIVLLIDQRFNYNYYKEIFPPEWRHIKYLTNYQRIKDEAEIFWEKQDNNS